MTSLSSSRRALVARPHRARALVVLLLLVVGCARGHEVEDVAMRLGPASFARPQPDFRDPVVQIGDDARPAIEQPLITVLAQRRAIPIENGRARFTVQLGPEARTMPDASFLLAVKHHRPDARADDIALGASALHFVRRDAGWRLLRPPDDPSRVTIEVDEPDAPSGTTLEVQIQSIGRVADELTSAPFAVPPRARMLLAFGVARPPRDPEPGDTVFAARLACDGRDEILLHELRLDAEAQQRRVWHDAAVPLPASGSRCRLRLTTAGAAAVAGSGVWAVPIVLSRPDAGEGHAPRRNVVLISLDTLRADHLSAYGYPRPTSPRIDAQLAARGALFEDVSTTFPLTSPSHLSLMTGLFAGAMPRMGVLDPWTPARTLAEVLRDAGFVTAAYTEDALLAGVFGFWLGFDRFVERPLVGEARGTATFADGARFLRANRDRRFFLFLHTYKVHAPYTSSERYADLFTDPADWSGVLAGRGVPPSEQPKVDAYDRTIREADDQVAGFLAELTRLGLDDETYVVLLSDHGEAFGEHGVVGHGFGGHQEQLRIPLLLRGPDVPAGVRSDVPASIVDVVPTVLDLLGLPALDVQGASLRPALAGDAPELRERPLPFAWLAEHARGVRLGKMKLLQQDPEHVVAFDLASDPNERRPTADATTIAKLRGALDVALADDARRRTTLASAGEVRQGEAASERMMESLRALGYVE